jgi:hypothetical protein
VKLACQRLSLRQERDASSKFWQEKNWDLHVFKTRERCLIEVLAGDELGFTFCPTVGVASTDPLPDHVLAPACILTEAVTNEVIFFCIAVGSPFFLGGLALFSSKDIIKLWTLHDCITAVSYPTS